jgi:hypothetical protein
MGVPGKGGGSASEGAARRRGPPHDHPRTRHEGGGAPFPDMLMCRQRWGAGERGGGGGGAQGERGGGGGGAQGRPGEEVCEEKGGR